MGPGPSSNRRNSNEPPVFHPDQDHLEWRKSVSAWVDLIKASAEGGEEKLYKTLFATLGRRLFESLPFAQKSIIEEAQVNGKIDYKQSDSIKAVKQIVDLIAIDPPITVVTRLIDTFNAVINCKRGANETITNYVSRFHGLASKHLIRAGTTSSEQIGEVLAITVLNNANLSSTNLNQAKMNLIALAQGKEDDNKGIMLQINENQMKMMREAVEVSATGIASSRFDHNDRKVEILRKMQDLRKNARKAASKMRTLFLELHEQKEKERRRQEANEIAHIESRGILRLQDAIDVLLSLSQNTTANMGARDLDAVDGLASLSRGRNNNRNNNRMSISNLVHNNDKSINHRGSMLASFIQNRNNRRNSPLQEKRSLLSHINKNRSRYPTNRYSNKNSVNDLCKDVCKDCGSPDHFRGSPLCKNPSFATKQIQAQKKQDNNRGWNENKYNQQKETPKKVRFENQSSYMTNESRAIDFFPPNKDPNPIVDVGCPRSVGGIESASSLALALGINFQVEELDCEPFMHGYGEKCSDARITIGIWSLPLTDPSGKSFMIPFYVTKGDGVLLLGNNVLQNAVINGADNFILFPPNTFRNQEEEVSIPTFTTTDNNNRTHLHLVPSSPSEFKSLLSHCVQGKDSRPYGKSSREFANKLHLFTHMNLRDSINLCKRAGILTPVLKQALKNSVESCNSCKVTGKPLHNKKISLNKVLREFNDDVQLDFMWIKKLTNSPILHIRDSYSGYSAALITENREMDLASYNLQIYWININGPPTSVSADLEFDNDDFKKALKTYDISFNRRPARRHQKMGSIESSNFVLRMITEKILADEDYQLKKFATKTPIEVILSKAVFVSNIMYGQKLVSPFELARGFTPSIACFPKSPVDETLVKAHREQVARRAIHKLLRSKRNNACLPTAFQKGDKIYFFEKQTKFGKWILGYVQSVEDSCLLISKNKYGSGKKLTVAYEDVRLYPSSVLLQELDDIELSSKNDEEIENESPVESAMLASNEEMDCDKPKSNDELENQSNINENSDKVEKQNPIKDIGDTKLKTPKESEELKSSEQEVLRGIKDIIGFEPVTEAKIRFAPRWVVEKAIMKELENYTEKKAYEEVHVKDLPKDANLISSHCFFQIKYDGDEDILKLKCRLVPHGNRDKDKDEVRKDSNTAQFPVIRALLAIASFFGLRIAIIDISGAYLQAGPLPRLVFMRPPPGWSSSPLFIWKLLKPAYGLAESGRIWQLAVEKWLRQNYNIETIAGFPQLFIIRSSNSKIPKLLIAKIVDDFLIAGNPTDIQEFNDNISQKFKVGRFILDKDVMFNRLNISQDEMANVTISMTEYMSKINPIPLSRQRRKQQMEKCTSEERTKYLGLAGQLNWLGHGVLPQASFVASRIQQYTGDLRVKHISEANQMLFALKKLNPTITYKAPGNTEEIIGNTTILTFSDASQGTTTYGQTGYVSGILFPNNIYHVIDWHSSKQNRVSFSSMGAEIIAAADSADRSILLSYALRRILNLDSPLPLILTIDSHGLYSTITTLHEGKDYRLRPTVCRLRDSFESGELSVVQWVAGTNNIADALTKCNPVLFQKLASVVNSGVLTESILQATKTESRSNIV